MNKLSKYLTTISKSFWFQWIPSVLLGLTTILLLAVGVIPLYYLCYTFIMWMLVCGLGIAVGYHRIFSHKTHNLPTWKENIILFFRKIFKIFFDNFCIICCSFWENAWPEINVFNCSYCQQ